jgi:2-haloacid dehalogenase
VPTFDRRIFLASATATVGLLAGTAGGRGTADSADRRRVKAIAFDGFPIIDPRPLNAKAEELFPGKGEVLLSAWRTRQFEYTWLRTLSGHYADFWHTTGDALLFAAHSLGMSLGDTARERLMRVYLELQAWPDVRAALESLRSAGIRMAFLSNFTAPMLDAALYNSGLQGFFEPHLSTDRVRAYKPHPSAYAMALGAFGATRDEIVFCASAGWDAAGAKWFGYKSFWVNRMGQLSEELGVSPDGVGSGMADLVKFVLYPGIAGA